MDWLKPLLRNSRPSQPGVDQSWTDREIQSHKDDSFGFVEYADVLANQIREAGTPITFGIYGRWGSGKSSLMRLVDEAVTDPARDVAGRVQTLWINVWQLSNEDEVWHAFLQAVFSDVEQKIPLWRRIDFAKLVKTLLLNSYRIVVVVLPAMVGAYLNLEGEQATLEQVVEVLLFQQDSVSGAGAALVTYALGVFAVVKPAWEAARGVVHFDVKSVLRYGSYEEQITELRQLQERFEKLLQLLIGKDGRLVVFVDDLDRCTPDKVAEVLEAIKLFASTDQCVYVLAIDHAIVRKGIEAKYRFKTDESAEYLEKIVQVPFSLPPLDEGAMERFVRDVHPQVVEQCPSVAAVFAQGLESNPRKVKRALNIYRTIRALADRRVSVWEMDPVNDELTAKMVALQTRFRSLHEALVTEPEVLLELDREARKTGPGLQGLALNVQQSGEATKLLFGDDAVVNEGDIPALQRLLGAGDRSFNDADQRDLVAAYIFLSDVADGTDREIRPSRRQREALLGNDEVEMRKMVQTILQPAWDDTARKRVVSTYLERLENVIRSPERYEASERLSANRARDEFLGIKWNPQLEPRMLYIPAGLFRMGSDSDEIEQAGRMGLDIGAAKREQPSQWINVPGFRISRYPVTVAMYRKFVEDEAWWKRLSDQRSSPYRPPPRPSLEHMAYGTPVFQGRLIVGTTVGIGSDASLGRVSLDIDHDGDPPSGVRLRMSIQDATNRKVYIYRGITAPKFATTDDDMPAETGRRFLMDAGELLARVHIVQGSPTRASIATSLPGLISTDDDSVDSVDAVELAVTVWNKATWNDRFWGGPRPELPKGDGDLPVAHVAWIQAVQYCDWLGAQVNRPYRLPSEAEWEAAARGEQGRIFPWGNEWKDAVANTTEAARNKRTDSTEFSPAGDSVFCVGDMAGNVKEWCGDVFATYTARDESGLYWDEVRFGRALDDAEERSVRGGAYNEGRSYARCASRAGFDPTIADDGIGFRVVLDDELLAVEVV